MPQPTAHNVADLLRELEALRAAQRIEHRQLAELERFRLLGEHVPGVIYLCRNDERYTILYVNDMVEEVTGHPRQAFIEGRVCFADLFHPDDAAGIRGKVNAAVAARERFHLLYRLRHADGQWRWIEELGQGVFQDGGPVLLEGYLHDVTERKEAEAALRQAHDDLENRVAQRTERLAEANAQLQEALRQHQEAERALRESEARFRTIFDAAPVGIAITDPRMQLTQVNRAYAQMMGYEPSEMIGMSFLDVTHPDDMALSTELFEQIFTNQTSDGRLLKRYQRKDASVVWAKVAIATVRDGDSRMLYTVAMVEDITQHKQAEEQAQRQREHLAHVARRNTMGEMASGLAHELNQPLTAIANFAHGCLHRIEQETPDCRELTDPLRQIARQAQRAAEIIRRIRRFVRKHEGRYSTVDVNEVVRDIVAFIAPDANQQGIRIRLDLPAGMPTILADTIQLEQVILNLLRNACEAMAAPEVRRRELFVRTRVLDEQLRIAVEDSGPGLPAGEREQVFEPYFSSKPDGMGMGLTISRSSIEAMAGRLWAEPNPTGGSTFVVQLPLATPARTDT